MHVKPLKKFGQNYLIDQNIVRKMIDVLQLKSSNTVLEIGPGKGFITKELFCFTNSVSAVEIDSRVISELKKRFPDLNLIENNILKLNFKELDVEFPIKIIGNIPFNLTGSILYKLIEEKKLVEQAVLIIPHDIAKRIVAQKRTKEYGILTVLFNYFSTSKFVSKISPNVFSPKPNIDAAIINIEFNKNEQDNIRKDVFINVVKASFGNRRKTLNNSLRNSIFKNCDFSDLDFPFEKRAEELEVPDFLKLTEYIQIKCQ